jgi:hypothetical protein
MNTLFFMFALILPILIGFLLVSLCWPGKKMVPPLLWCKICVSMGIGLGISSCTSFLTLLLTGSANILFTFLLEILLIAVLGGILRYKNQPFFSSFKHVDEEATTLAQILAFVFYISLVLAIGVFTLRSLENPHGEPDAFYLWNSCARFLFRSGEQWRNMFTANTWSHPDYPLLLPTNVLRLWSAFGKETLFSPTIIAFFFTSATIGVLVSALWVLRGRSQAYMGGIILASTPYFIKHGASQYADVPLGFYMLATLVFIALYDEYPRCIAGGASIIGMSLGCAVWTKNEGMLFLFTVLLAYVLIKGGFYREESFFRKGVFPLVGGLLPFILIVVYFKIAIAPPNDLMSGQNFQQTVSKLTNFSRYTLIGKAFIRQIVEPYSLVYSTPLILFGIYGLFLGLNTKQLKKPGLITSIFIVSLMFGGYFFIYIITPHDLNWHLATSLSRLFLQLWPSSIFLAFMVIATPQERFSKRKG